MQRSRVPAVQRGSRRRSNVRGADGAWSAMGVTQDVCVMEKLLSTRGAEARTKTRNARTCVLLI